MLKSVRVSSKSETPTVSPKSETRINLNRHPKYSRVPWEILTDRTISSDAKLVYGALAAWVFQGRVAYIGQRLIADMLGFSPAKVNRLLKSLSAYVEAQEDGRGKRSFYVLKSAVFAQKAGKVNEIVSAPSGGRRLANVERRSA